MSKALRPWFPNEAYVRPPNPILEARLMRGFSMRRKVSAESALWEIEHPLDDPANLAEYVRQHREAAYEIMLTDFYPHNIKLCLMSSTLKRADAEDMFYIMHGRTPKMFLPEAVPQSCKPNPNRPGSDRIPSARFR